MQTVTILILIDGFLQSKREEFYNSLNDVTILILIDGFLQSLSNIGDSMEVELSQSLF